MMESHYFHGTFSLTVSGTERLSDCGFVYMVIVMEASACIVAPL